MKRFILILVIALLTPLAVAAQKGLHVDEVFTGRYVKLPTAVVTYISGNKLKDYDLSLYRSITLKCDQKTAAEVENMVMNDGATSQDKETAYQGGHLRYGFFQLPKSGSANNYLFFIRKAVDADNVKVTVIFMSGRATKQRILKMINSK